MKDITTVLNPVQGVLIMLDHMEAWRFVAVCFIAVVWAIAYVMKAYFLGK
ncbi:hypothetical protein JGUZn3_21100 [Entomobacter blattae]|uniref:Uncharacterized protein n=1 Tax=Entomobacter blattae TaxID=2762277 RepID=A0A7H1NU53_9PROT|nr:hypothetical protein JGUZn3_21100 [Entomobacter blattae]